VSEVKPDPKAYVIGGPVQARGGIYIPRRADEELLGLCLAGTFAYVLAPRQLGKSSLMERTIQSLRERGVRTAKVDLNGIGTQVTAEQWYLGILTILESQLGLATDIYDWWTARAHLGTVQRMAGFFEVIAEEVGAPTVIFIDEIDSTLRLPFSDDLFAAIRYLYHARLQTPILERLTFVLIGVATPGDLIKDRLRTPFNVGQRVDLSDFSVEEALPLAAGLGLPDAEARRLLGWVLAWTGGHPYLTQRLLRAIADQGKKQWSRQELDTLVASTFFGAMAKKDTNLNSVRDMLAEPSPFKEEALRVYSDVLRGRRVPDEEQSVAKSHLKLSGVVRSENGLLRVRNRIYREVFNKRWVEEHLPADWKRRLTRAAVRLALVLLVLSFPVGMLALYQWQKATENARELEKSANALKVSARDLEAKSAALEEALLQEGKLRKVAQEQGRIAEERGLFARRAAEKERRARSRADEERRKADFERQRAVAGWNEAERLRQVAFGRQLASQALSTGGSGGPQARLLQRSVLLARESLRQGYSEAAYQALNRGLGLLPEPTVLLQQPEPVSAVAFDPEGRFMATVENDRIASRYEMAVWDGTGRQVARLPQDSAIEALARAPGGSFLATVDQEKVQVWEWRGSTLAVSREIDRLDHMELIVDLHVVAVSATGEYVAVAPREVAGSPLQRGASLGSAKETEREAGKAYLLHVASGRRIALEQARAVTALAFCPQADCLVTAGADGEAKVWGWSSTEAQALSRVVHSGAIRSIAFSPDGKYLVTGGEDGAVQVWDWKGENGGGPSPSLAVARVVHEGPVTDIGFSPDGIYLATASEDDTGRLWAGWRTLSPVEVSRMIHEDNVNGIAVGPGARSVATASDDHTVRLWRGPGERGKDRILLGTGIATYEIGAIGQGYRALAVVDEAGNAQVWDLADGRLAGTFKIEGSVDAMAVSGDARRLAVATDGDDMVRVWDVASGRPVFGQKGSLVELSFDLLSANGRYLAIVDQGEESPTVSVWDVEREERLLRLETGGEVGGVSFSPDGRSLVVTSYDGSLGATRVDIWAIPGGRLVASIPHPGRTGRAVFDPTGRLFASASDTHVYVWSVLDGSSVASVEGGVRIDWIALSPGGRLLATASSDQTARVFSIPDGREVAKVGHQDSVDVVSFSSDGRYLVSASGDDTAVVLDVAGGCEIARLRLEGQEGFAFFGPNQKYLVTGSDNSVQLQLWRPEDLIARVCSHVTRNLTAEEWHDQYLIEEPLPNTCGPPVPEEQDRSERVPSRLCPNRPG